VAKFTARCDNIKFILALYIVPLYGTAWFALRCYGFNLVLGLGARRKGKVHVPHQGDTIARQDLKLCGHKTKIERLDWDPQNLSTNVNKENERSLDS
jgi:hypothetical protein